MGDRHGPEGVPISVMVGDKVIANPPVQKLKLQ